MKKRIYRRLALLISLIMLITSSVQTTYGYIVVKTNTLVNTFVPGESVASFLQVTGTKNLIGRDWQEGDEFVFMLDELTDTSEWVNRGSEVVTFDDTDKTFDFSDVFQDIDIYNPGIYSFLVYEEQGSMEGITYDDSLCVITVTTDLDSSGTKLEIKSVTASGADAVVTQGSNGVYNINVTFKNYYGAVTSDYVDVYVDKTVVNTNGGSEGPDGFTFELKRKELIEQAAGASGMLPDLSIPAVEGEGPEGPVMPSVPPVEGDEPPAAGGDEPPATGGDEPPATGGDEPPVTGGDEPPVTGGDEPPVTGGDEPPASGGEEPVNVIIMAPLPDEGDGDGDTQQPPVTGGAEPPVTGGDEPPATGGDEPPVTGGDEPPATGGDEPPATGGDEPPATGGDEPPATGGDEPPVAGGDEPPAPAEVGSNVVLPEENTYGITDSNGNLKFKLQFTNEDVGRTYEYVLSEVNDYQDDFVYDTRTYEFTITVAMVEGRVEATASGLPGSCAFVNQYTAEVTPGPGPGPGTDPDPDPFEPVEPEPMAPAAALMIMVDKTVTCTGSVIVNPQGFEFILEDTATGTQIIEETGYSGTAYFNKTYTTDDAGKTFNYKLYEVSSSVEGISYDETVYDISVTVSVKDKAPVLETYVDGVKYNGGMIVLDFTNIETSGVGDTSLTLDVQKNVVDPEDETPSLKGYKFILEDVTVYAAEGAPAETIRTAKSNSSGKASFDLGYTKDDIGKTFSYRLYEEAGKNENMQYDTTVYDIQVTVGLTESKGIYHLETAVTCNGVAVEDISTWAAEFTNMVFMGAGEEDDAGSGTFEEDIPKTGDTSNLPLWFFTMIISALACFVLLSAEVRDRRNN